MIAAFWLFAVIGALGASVLAGYGAHAAWERLRGRRHP
jgi:hypothetical protein